MRSTKRIASVTLTVAAAVGLTLGFAAPALADTGQAYVVKSATGDSSGACNVFLLSAQVSPGGPGYVSALVGNSGTKTCAGWIERSVNKGKTWTTVSSRVAVPHGTVSVFAKSGDYYAGGDLARPCYQYGSGKPGCGAAVSLAASTARDTGGSLPVSYGRTQVSVGTTRSQCMGGVASTTPAKDSASSVDVLFLNITTTLAKPGVTCTGVLQESANGGKTWKTVSGGHVLPSPVNSAVYGFTSTFADGTGRVARVCVTVASSPKAAHCSAAW